MVFGQQAGKHLLLGVVPVLLAKRLADRQRPAGNQFLPRFCRQRPVDRDIDRGNQRARAGIDIDAQVAVDLDKFDSRREIAFGDSISLTSRCKRACPPAPGAASSGRKGVSRSAISSGARRSISPAGASGAITIRTSGSKRRMTRERTDTRLFYPSPPVVAARGGSRKLRGSRRKRCQMARSSAPQWSK